jgi:hypothetical protein
MIKANLLCFPGCYCTEYDQDAMLGDSFDTIAEHFLKEDTGCPHCRVDRLSTYTADRHYGSLSDWSDGYIDAVGAAYVEVLHSSFAIVYRMSCVRSYSTGAGRPSTTTLRTIEHLLRYRST